MREPQNPLSSLDQLSESINAHATDAPSGNLRSLLTVSEQLRTRKSETIHFEPAFILRDDAPVIFPKTINAIQGQTGSHKSRLAEVFCALILKTEHCKSKFLGFQRGVEASLHHVVYVDTERNLGDQFPHALQRIQELAGYKRTDNPERFHYTSLLEIQRTERFQALREFIEQVRRNIGNKPLVVVLDVTSDCIDDFNRTESSLQLIDLMNVAINRQNVTFICVLHENPGSEKMRGHLGTELSNKSSTVIQVAFEKDAKQRETDLLRVTFKKCRSSRRHEPFHMKYSEVGHELILADEIDLITLDNDKKAKAAPVDTIRILSEILGNGQRMKRSVLIEELRKRTEASANTVESRLAGIRETDTLIENGRGEKCVLSKEPEGRYMVYFLSPVLDAKSSSNQPSQSQSPI